MNKFEHQSPLTNFMSKNQSNSSIENNSHIVNCYDTSPLNDDKVMSELGGNKKIVSYNPQNESHADLLAATDYGYGNNNFKNPLAVDNQGNSRQIGESITPSRVFINQSDNKVVGINLNYPDGNFCCSYLGDNLNDIKSFNELDIGKNKTQDYSMKNHFDNMNNQEENKQVPTEELTANKDGIDYE